jgi:hypothetical protein
MTSKKYFCSTIILSSLIAAVIVSFNIYMNEYGLWGNAKGKSIKIWHNERTTKYLLSYNYIPANFEGILIGPSVSANLDTKKISGFKVYNASLNGGNISELKYIAENVIQKGNLRFVIICLYPYMTKDHGRKTSSLDPREYWESLGSLQILYLYFHKALIKLDFQHDTFNDYGYDNFNLKAEEQTSIELKASKRINYNGDILLRGASKKIIVTDEIAYKELAQLVDLARSKGIKIFGYYYPYYLGNYEATGFNSYKDKIDKIFTQDDIIWNMNVSKYDNFRSDLSNYYDREHLSWKGADFLICEINKKLSIFYME